MQLSEVEDIQLRIVQKVRQLEEQGQVNIARGSVDDRFIFLWRRYGTASVRIRDGAKRGLIWVAWSSPSMALLP